MVWCTGYNYTFPFLEESGLLTPPSAVRVHPLYEQVWHTQHPSLSFVGIPQRYGVVPGVGGSRTDARLDAIFLVP